MGAHKVQGEYSRQHARRYGVIQASLALRMAFQNSAAREALPVSASMAAQMAASPDASKTRPEPNFGWSSSGSVLAVARDDYTVGDDSPRRRRLGRGFRIRP